MATATSVQLTLPFSKEDLLASKALIAQSESSLTFLRPLKSDDVKSTAKLDNNREGFIRDVIGEMTNANGTIPTLANLEKLITFYAYYAYSFDIEDIYKQHYEKAKRNHIWYGDKTFDQALRFYSDLDDAIKDEIEGAEAEQTLTLALIDFTSADGPPSSWAEIDQLGLCAHFAAQGTSANQVPLWKGAAPKFLRLSWNESP